MHRWMNDPNHSTLFGWEGKCHGLCIGGKNESSVNRKHVLMGLPLASSFGIWKERYKNSCTIPCSDFCTPHCFSENKRQWTHGDEDATRGSGWPPWGSDFDTNTPQQCIRGGGNCRNLIIRNKPSDQCPYAKSRRMQRGGMPQYAQIRRYTQKSEVCSIRLSYPSYFGFFT